MHVALYTYDSDQPTDLAFHGGDRVEILEAPDDGWWRGKLGDREGWFPATYLDPVPLSEAEIQVCL